MKIITVLACIAMIGCGGESVETRQQVYHSWMKLNQMDEKQLAFNQWDMLYRREMLPGQDLLAAKRAANNAASMSAFTAGMAAGTAAGGTRK
jgi:hypothetical protein